MMRTIGRGFLLQTAAIILVPLLCASVLAAQEPLQFNVPYHCPDGTDNIITRCAPYKGRETCIWRVEKNGQLIHEVSNVRSQMDGWLAVCKVQTHECAGHHSHGSASACGSAGKCESQEDAAPPLVCALGTRSPLATTSANPEESWAK